MGADASFAIAARAAAEATEAATGAAAEAEGVSAAEPTEAGTEDEAAGIPPDIGRTGADSGVEAPSDAPAEPDAPLAYEGAIPALCQGAAAADPAL